MKILWLMLVVLASTFPLMAAEVGEAHIYIFKPDSSTYQGVEVKSGEVKVVTDESGFALLELPEGKQTVTLSVDSKVVTEFPVTILPAEITEAVLTLGSQQEQKTLNMDVLAEEEAELEAKTDRVEASDVFGSVSGLVVDSKSQAPIAEARVFVRGITVKAKADATTDAEGRFTIKVPVGSYSVSSIHSEYTRQTLDNIAVVEDEETAVTMEMLPSAVELDAISVVAVKITGGVAALQEEKRESKKLLEIIGAEQMSKSGDSDAAAALKRVSGITVVDGKFIYVRGMGERYSKTLIDGLSLPSPIIERRVVPLDLFPADIIDSLVVQKTSSADQPGEFGGGLVQIRTRKLPEERILKLGVSVGYNSESTDEDGLTHIGGDRDFLGIDDGTRDLPSVFGGLDSSFADILDADLQAAALERAGESVRENWTPENTVIWPKGSASLTYGDTFGEKLPVGVFVTTSYSNATKNKITRSVNYSGRQGQQTVSTDSTKSETTNTVDLGGLLSIGTEIKEKHSLQFTTLLLRTTDKKSSIRDGQMKADDQDLYGQRYSLSWTEQELSSFAFHGEHDLKDEKLILSWDYGISKATREQPDWRWYELLRDISEPDSVPSVLDKSDIFFQPSELDDESDDVNVDLSYKFDVKDLEAEVSVGHALSDKERKYRPRIFRFEQLGDGDGVGGYPIEPYLVEDILRNQDNIVGSAVGTAGANVFKFSESAPSQYDASQETKAYYVMMDLTSAEKYDLNFGGRYEVNEQTITSVETGDEKSEEVEDSDFLPSINFNYKGIEGQQFRFGYSRTLNRPSFNEFANIGLQTGKGDPFYTGSLAISQATLDHLDFRWEFFFDEFGGESFSLSLFGKSIDKPIIAAEASAGETLEYRFGNAEEADVYGVEFDLRKNADFLKEAWKDYVVSLNLTLVKSEVSGFVAESFTGFNPATGTGTVIEPEDGQELTGQAPVVFNFSLGYDNPETGLNWAFLYNYVDERIIALAPKGFANKVLEPTHQLDFVLGGKVYKKWSLKAKIQNILNDDHEVTQDGMPHISYKRGVDFSMGVSMKL